jgi:hypothetical protein
LPAASARASWTTSERDEPGGQPAVEPDRHHAPQAVLMAHEQLLPGVVIAAAGAVDELVGVRVHGGAPVGDLL